MHLHLLDYSLGDNKKPVSPLKDNYDFQTKVI